MSGKALTGGYLTLAATLCSSGVAASVSAGEGGGLAHGPTFMANPLACAVAQASIGLLRAQDWAAGVRRIETGLRAGLEPLRGAAGVADVRVLGAIGVVQLDHPVDVAKATAAAVGAGVWLRPFRDLIYTMPPYVTGDADVAAITRGVAAAVRADDVSGPSLPPRRHERGTSMETFGTRLHRAVGQRGPLCVGIDPHAALLARWGLPDDVGGLERFARTVVDALADRVAVLKPQSAFFERFGSRGVAVLESTIRQSRRGRSPCAPRREAGRHRLDDGRVRRRLP